jgi:hypothetical protein
MMQTHGMAEINPQRGNVIIQKYPAKIEYPEFYPYFEKNQSLSITYKVDLIEIQEAHTISFAGDIFIGVLYWHG